jgi:NAD(P)-dependent dehydrogenase (short-subunit alcohol dehydrogenase family)
MRLDGKVALVVGAGGGMGTAVPALFAREGARVVVAARREGPMRELVAAIQAHGGAAAWAAGDGTTAEGAASIVEQTIRHYGRLDILYSNLGDYAYGDRRPHETSPAEWDYLLALNLTGHFLCARAAIPAMLGRGGSIILVAATQAVYRGANPGYAAGKAGLVALTKSLARQYRADNIRVNCICPGSIGGSHGDDDFADPPAILDRNAHPADIAHAGLYFASDTAAWITGQALDVDGGQGL